MHKLSICLVDDEEILRVSLRDDLIDAGYIVRDFDDPVSALNFLRVSRVDVVISDMRMPGMDGLELLSRVKSIDPGIFFVIMTAYGSVGNAVEAMKTGAYDYIMKPFSKDELILLLKRIEELSGLRRRNREFTDVLRDQYNCNAFVGISEFTKNLKETLKVVASSNSTVLISGETGTGKELLANLIHYNSPRRDKPLVKVSCAILSREVIESELFGHEKGAFTGADKQHIARFEKADQGTIYLDDIDDVPLDVQVKLLRVLQEQEIERVGGNESIKIDVRVIASTKADLLKLSREGKFREDLYYRLNIIPVDLKPLRERREDIAPLFDHFIKQFAGDRHLKIEDEVYDVIWSYSWPGNTRELKNLAERLAILSTDERITVSKLPQEFFNISTVLDNIDCAGKSLNEILDSIEKRLIKSALTKSGGSKSKAADLLGVPPSTLKSKIEKLQLE